MLFQAPTGKSCFCVNFGPLLSTSDNGIGKEEEGERGGKKCVPHPGVVAGYSDGTVRMFDVNQGRMVRKMQPHAESVKAVVYSYDSELELCCAMDFSLIPPPFSLLLLPSSPLPSSFSLLSPPLPSSPLLLLPPLQVV